MIAIVVPRVPTIFVRSFADFVLSFAAGATDRDHVAPLNARAALRRGDLRLSLANDDLIVALGVHFNAVDAILLIGVNGDV